MNNKPSIQDKINVINLNYCTKDYLLDFNNILDVVKTVCKYSQPDDKNIRNSCIIFQCQPTPHQYFILFTDIAVNLDEPGKVYSFYLAHSFTLPETKLDIARGWSNIEFRLRVDSTTSKDSFFDYLEHKNVDFSLSKVKFKVFQKELK